MSRPLKRGVDYFPHYVNQGKTLNILKNRFGNDGYAFWFQLLELLAKEADHKYNISSLDNFEYMLSYTGVTETVAKECLELLAKLSKINPESYESGMIYCDALVENLAPLYTKRERMRGVIDSRNSSFKGVTDSRNSVTGGLLPAISTQSKVKESKVKKSKVKTYGISLNRETWKLEGTDTLKPELVARFPLIDTDAELEKVNDWCYKKQGEAIKKKDWAAFIRNWFASPYEKVLRRVDPPAPPKPANLYEESARRASERIKAHEAKFKMEEVE